jgi:MFS family permease
VAKFAGIFAAIGLALGAIGTALAALLGGLFNLAWWQIPLVFVGVMLLISGPAVVVAWFKLRSRNLGPILDANGWAINARARINIPFGTTLTQLAQLPANAERTMADPYADKPSKAPYVLVALAVLALVIWAVRL